MRPKGHIRTLIGCLRRDLPRIGPVLRYLLFANPFYFLTLLGRSPAPLSLTPPYPWPGNASRGNAILHGEFSFAGETVSSGENLWSPPGVSEACLEEIHGFAWINDLHAIGSDAARRSARALVADWINTHKRWSPIAWRADLTGVRIAAWLGRHDFFCASADEDFRARFFASLYRQTRHLSRVAAWETRGAGKILAIKGLIYTGLCLPDGQRYLAKGLKLLDKEIARQILADGGHYERSPQLQLAVLQHFIDIRATFIAAQREVPAALQSAIDRMAPMLRFFRHGDGGLVLFNDSTEGERWLLDMVLTRADAQGKPLTSSPHSGFQRLNANRTLVIMESGAAVRGVPETHTHAGTLSFEMSIGKERLIVNCGAHVAGNSTWWRAQRTTAAHSTLTLGDTSSTEFSKNGRLGRRPENVTCRRDENGGNIWIEASHDGYEEIFNIIHRRRLYLAAGGEDFRGEDVLIATADASSFTANRPFTVRFHLHPGVRASLLHNRSAVLLRLPSGQGWRLRASGGEIGLSESIYLGRPNEIRRCEQVTISGSLGRAGATVKWSITRVSDKT